jgi:hypothetical protein
MNQLASLSESARTIALERFRGRWINRDPIGEAGGINLYAYSSHSLSELLVAWPVIRDQRQRAEFIT